MQEPSPPVSRRPRRLWQSADKRSCLYVGDSLRLLAELRAESVDCVWTDPPYFLSNGGITCASGRMVSVDKGAWDKSAGLAETHEFNREWINAVTRVLRPGGSFWVSGTSHIYPSLGMALREAGLLIINDIVWEKPAPPPNLARRAFTHATEMLFWATKPIREKKKHTFNYDEMRRENAGKQMKNIWRLSTPKLEEKRFGKHPTQKPVALVSRCLRASTNPGDVVLDPFAGSGTTGVAAISLRRRFIGCELESDFAGIAAKRLRATLPDSLVLAPEGRRDEASLWDGEVKAKA